jgi:hypothetical protein
VEADGRLAGFVLVNRWSALNRLVDHVVAEFLFFENTAGSASDRAPQASYIIRALARQLGGSYSPVQQAGSIFLEKGIRASIEGTVEEYAGISSTRWERCCALTVARANLDYDKLYRVKPFRRWPIRLALRMSLLAIGLASLFGAGAAPAGPLIEFPNVSEREPKLLGYLARPTGEGPFPAVVVLHGCGGFSSGGSLQLADQLIALMVDSLTPRGLTTACGGPFIDQPGDAYAALRYLSQQSFVAPERVAVLGNSMGGYSALYAIDRGLMAQICSTL